MASEASVEDDAQRGQPLTVSALNRAVAALLARGFPLVRVLGEVSGFLRAASGHWYFALKDERAQVRCVMFRSRNALLVQPPRDGDAVEVLAQVALYEPRGDYQLLVESLQPAGPGRLYERFLQLRDRLAAEGLFDAARKRPLPALPRAIGVVTSLQAAALRDVLATLAQRAPYCRVIVYPVPVQGEGAAGQIAAMLDAAGRRGEVDLLLLVRGGGSLEDLWAFNEEIVARAIRACALPVVVGVGHESDFTIADFAADARAPTPTAAAALAAPERAAMLGAVDERRRRLHRVFGQRLSLWQQRVDYAQRALAAPAAPLVGVAARLRTLALRMRHALAGATTVATYRLADATARLQRSAPAPARQQPHVRACTGALVAAARRAHRQRSDAVQALAARLVALDPHAVLARGYAVVTDPRGHVVTDASRLQLGDALRLRLARGVAAARVEGVQPDGD
ncbi:MAG: exodeoxyribonuclease VII large subunit [Burkholderiaceae bacterium]|nr:exodeoxyribonuclease VII large subunit [Burkholderiaceae bacterium]